MAHIKQLTDEEMMERDLILFGDFDKTKYSGGIREFENVHADTIKKLVSLGYADLQARYNNCPTLKTFIDFCERYPEFSLHGFAVSNDRDDCRIDVEGVYLGEPVDNGTHRLLDWTKIFRRADEKDLDTGWIWYD